MLGTLTKKKGKKNGSTVQLARQGMANKWCTVCRCQPYKPVTWPSRIDESTCGSATRNRRKITKRNRGRKRGRDRWIIRVTEREKSRERKKEDEAGARWESSLLPLGSKVSSRRGGRGPPSCSPAATGSHPPVPYVIRITCVSAWHDSHTWGAHACIRPEPAHAIAILIFRL